MSARRTLAASILLALGASCARSEHVASGPIEVGPTPVEVAFDHEVSAEGPRRDLVLDFALPAASFDASRLRAVLVAADGTREDFAPATVVRRGEALVALCVDRGAEASSGVQRYRAVELSCDRPLRLRSIRWWSGPR